MTTPEEMSQAAKRLAAEFSELLGRLGEGPKEPHLPEDEDD